jgi:hypothetical protein
VGVWALRRELQRGEALKEARLRVTWREFVKWCEEQGVKDDDEIGAIDFLYNPDALTRSVMKDGTTEVNIC